jgi:hypothetical protein
MTTSFSPSEYSSWLRFLKTSASGVAVPNTFGDISANGIGLLCVGSTIDRSTCLAARSFLPSFRNHQNPQTTPNPETQSQLNSSKPLSDPKFRTPYSQFDKTPLRCSVVLIRSLVPLVSDPCRTVSIRMYRMCTLVDCGGGGTTRRRKLQQLNEKNAWARLKVVVVGMRRAGNWKPWTLDGRANEG